MINLTTRLQDVVDLDLLAYHLEHKNIRKQSHPFAPLDIYNYTERCQFEKIWDDTTKACRGLIVNSDTDEVVARPFPKFFNWGEVENDRSFQTSGMVQITDKMDGSLGILYRWEGNNYIATRGSFSSDQALRATKILHEKYADFIPYEDVTYLFEIIYPENRIVLNYGETEDLYLLDILSNGMGTSVLYHPITLSDNFFVNWWGPQTPRLKHYSLDQALAAKPRPNKEGMVVYFKNYNTRVKIKQEDYVRLHRILTNVSSKSIWECLRKCEGLDEILNNVPDEFYDWVQDEIQDLQTNFDGIATESWQQYVGALYKLAHDTNQEYLHSQDARERKKQFALAIKDEPNKALLFAYYDDQSVDDMIWKLVKPVYSRPFMAVSEDVA